MKRHLKFTYLIQGKYYLITRIIFSLYARILKTLIFMTIKNANLIIYSEILSQFILRICLAKRENNYFLPRQIYENLRIFYLEDLILTRKLD